MPVRSRGVFGARPYSFYFILLKVIILIQYRGHPKYRKIHPKYRKNRGVKKGVIHKLSTGFLSYPQVTNRFIHIYLLITMKKSKNSELQPLTQAELEKRLGFDGNEDVSEKLLHQQIDLTFMPRALIHCNLPYRKVLLPDGRPSPLYERRSNQLRLTLMSRVVGLPLPYGSMARMLFTYITECARKADSRVVMLDEPVGRMLARFGLQSSGGPRGTITRLREQMKSLAFTSATFDWCYSDSTRDAGLIENYPIFDRAAYDQPREGLLYFEIAPDRYRVILSPDIFREITSQAVPLNLVTLSQLQSSPMAMDLYSYLTYRMCSLKKPQLINWDQLHLKFGANIQHRWRFKALALRALGKVTTVYNGLKLDYDDEGIIIRPSLTDVPKVTKD